jgi:hypothetical protein
MRIRLLDQRTKHFLAVIGIEVLNLGVTWVVVAYCWIAVAQQKPSLIAGPIHRRSVNELFIAFFLVILIIEVLYLLAVINRAGLSPYNSRKEQAIHAYRVALGGDFIWGIALFEVIIFRCLYWIFQIDLSVGIGPRVTSLIVIEDVALVAIVAACMTWFKRVFAVRLARILNLSFAPVIGILSSGALVLSDGSTMSRGVATLWPENGIGNRQVALVMSGSRRRIEILVTQDGDCYESRE